MHVAVDGTIEHADSQEDEEEDNQGEKDVGLGVEWEESGASVQAAHTVPSKQREETNHQRQNPAKCHQAIDPIVALGGWLLGQRFHHGGVTLHGDQQQTEDGGCQGDKQQALSEEPESRGEAESLAAGHADVDHIGGAGEEVAECDVGNADVNPTAAVANAGQDSHQHQEVLQNDEDADEKENSHGGTDGVLGVWYGPVLQAARVVVMPQDHMADPSRALAWWRGVGGGTVVQMGAGGRRGEEGEDIHGDDWRIEDDWYRAAQKLVWTPLWSNRLPAHSNQWSSTHTHTPEIREIILFHLKMTKKTSSSSQKLKQFKRQHLNTTLMRLNLPLAVVNTRWELSWGHLNHHMAET